MHLIPTVYDAQRMGRVRTGGPKTMKRTCRFLLPVQVENCRFLEIQTLHVENFKFVVFGVNRSFLYELLSPCINYKILTIFRENIGYKIYKTG